MLKIRILNFCFVYKCFSLIAFQQYLYFQKGYGDCVDIFIEESQKVILISYLITFVLCTEDYSNNNSIFAEIIIFTKFHFLIRGN